MALTLNQFACVERRREPVTITNHTARYRTWHHAAYRVGYDSVSKTLCGRRFYDPMPEGQGWDTVDCESCKKAMARLEG